MTTDAINQMRLSRRARALTADQRTARKLYFGSLTEPQRSNNIRENNPSWFLQATLTLSL